MEDLRTWSDLINKYPDKFIVGATIDIGLGWYEYVEDIVNDCNFLIAKISRIEFFNRSNTLLTIQSFSNSNPCVELKFELKAEDVKKCEYCGDNNVIVKVFDNLYPQVLCNQCMTDFENKLKIDLL